MSVPAQDRHGPHPGDARRFAGAAWTSFDRFSRYTAICDALRANLGPGRHTVLDVGDASGYLAAFDAELAVASVDVTRQDDPLPGSVRLLGSGTDLPFCDDAFDAVVSADAIEHVQPDGRPTFLAEINRVARRVIVVAAPFDTEGVAQAEELVRRYAVLTVGAPQVQLEEHRQHGLPDLGETCVELTAAGVEIVVQGSGNLDDWTCMMMLKHQLMARPALAPLNAGYDIAYNGMRSARDGVPPYYRHIIVGTAGGGAPTLPVATARDGAGDSPLLAAFLAANAAEIVRQDVVPSLSRQEQRMDAIERALEDLHADLRRSMIRRAASRMKRAVRSFR